MQLINLTDLASARAVVTAPDGAQILAVGVKATYNLLPSGTVELSDQQEPIILAPRYIGDDASKTMLRDAELTLDHAGTDIIVNARAYIPQQRDGQTVAVSVAVGTLSSALQVTGDRRWIAQRGEVVPGPATPFTTMPIIYERAFGGGHDLENGGRIWDQRNPIGVGYCTEPGRLIGTLVPNVELGHATLDRAVAGKMSAVGGFAARPGHWVPRSAYAGTYDEEWRRNRLPFWPRDLDERFFRAASPALQSPVALRGHEEVTLRNLTVEGVLSFNLPRALPEVRTTIRGEKAFQPVHLRRIVIEPDLGKMTLLWRAMINCGADSRIVQRVVIDQRRIVRAQALAST